MKEDRDELESFQDRIEEWLKQAKDEVVKETFDLGVKQLDALSSVIGRIETKASGILSVVGLCLTLALTFGGWAMLQNLQSLQPNEARLIAIGFSLLMAVGVGAGVFAARALGVVVQGAVDERQVFDRQLGSAERADYQRVLSNHIWGCTTTALNLGNQSEGLNQQGVSRDIAAVLHERKISYLFHLVVCSSNCSSYWDGVGELFTEIPAKGPPAPAEPTLWDRLEEQGQDAPPDRST
jgi:hypothetical protein